MMVLWWDVLKVAYNELTKYLSKFKKKYPLAEINLIDSVYFSTLESLVNESDISLIIMGQDPYPTNACPIPFCKEEWDDMKGGYGCNIIFKIVERWWGTWGKPI